MPSSPSVILGELILSVGESSSSSIVIETPVTDPIPTEFCAVPVTVPVRLSSSLLLFTAVIVAVSNAFAVRPAAIVIFESIPTVYRSATGVIVIVVATLDAWLKLADTAAVPVSEIELSFRCRVTVGSSSLSVMVPVPVPADIPALIGSLSSMTTVSFCSSTSSPVTVTVNDLLRSPGAKVSVPPVNAK